MTIDTFENGSIYYESFRKHYYMLGKKKMGAHTMIEIIGCRLNPQDFRKERIEKTQDCRSIREHKAWLKIHYSEKTEYIKASRRGNAYNYIMASDTVWDGCWDEENKNDAETESDNDEEPLIRAPLARPVDYLKTEEVKKMIKDATAETVEEYEGRIEALKYGYEKEKEALKIKHRDETLELHNEFYNEKRNNDKAIEELKITKEIIKAQDVLLQQEMVKRMAIRTKEFEGLGLCYFSDISKEWHHYSDYG